MKRGLLRNDTAIGALLALIAFAVYAYTAAPSVLWEDAGEIAAAIHNLGIMHPTGYPLFTLLGHAWLDLPLGGRAIWRLNLLAALLCAAAVFLYYRLFLEMLRSALSRAGAGAEPPVSERARRIAAATGALTLAFSRVFWSNAVSIEVYGFHLLLAAGVILLFLKSLPPDFRGPAKTRERTWMLFAYTLGLSFANHMMTVLLAPAFLYAFFRAHGWGSRAWSRIAAAAPPFLLGLTPYLYLPVRASARPLMNWGDPSAPGNFWRHVTGEQYRYKMFSSFEIALRKLGDFLADLPSDFGWLPLALAILGAWALFRRSRPTAFFSALLFLGCVFYAVNYDFEDANFRLNAHVATAFWVACGMLWIAARFEKRRKMLPVAVVCVAAISFPFGLNFGIVEKREDYSVEDYVRNVLGSVDSGGVLITNEDGVVLFPAFYMQHAEGFRRDVAIVHLGLLRGIWYYSYLERTHPGILEAAGREVTEHRRAVDGQPVFAPWMETPGRDEAWLRAIRAVIRENARLRPVHVTFWTLSKNPLPIGFGSEFPLIPAGMTFRVFADAPPDFPVPGKEPVFRPFKENSLGAMDLKGDYPDAYANLGIYSAIYLRDTAQAVARFRKALKIAPAHATSVEWMQRLGVSMPSPDFSP